MSSHFDFQGFAKKILQDCKLNDVDAKTRQALTSTLEKLLFERLVATVVDQLSEEQIRLFERILADHPELDEIDAINLLLPNIPELSAIITKAMDDLSTELVYTAEQLRDTNSQ